MSKYFIDAQAFKATALFASNDKMRPVLNGVRLTHDAGCERIELVATDCYMMCRTYYDNDDNAVNNADTIIIPSAVAKNIKASNTKMILEHDEDTGIIDINLMDKHGAIVMRMTERAVDGTFPGIEGLIPERLVDIKDGAGVNPKQLISVMKSASLVGRGDYMVRMYSSGSGKFHEDVKTTNPFVFTFGNCKDVDCLALLMPLRVG